MKYLYTFNVARAEIVGIFYIEEPLKERRERAYNWLNDSLAKGLVNPGLKEDLSKTLGMIINAIAEVINSIDWDKVLDTCNKTLERVRKNDNI